MDENENWNNPHLRDWAVALRSGEYGQARSVMYDSVTNGYCCLGVACRLADVPLTDSGMAVIGIRPDGSPWHSADELPTWLRETLGLTENDVTEFVVMNDTLHYNFNRIAEVIEYLDRHDVTADVADQRTRKEESS